MQPTKMDCVIWVILQNSGTSFRTIGCVGNPSVGTTLHFFKGGNGHVAWPTSFLIGHVNVGGFYGEFEGTYVLNGILWLLNNHG